MKYEKRYFGFLARTPEEIEQHKTAVAHYRSFLDIEPMAEFLLDSGHSIFEADYWIRHERMPDRAAERIAAFVLGLDEFESYWYDQSGEPQAPQP